MPLQGRSDPHKWARPVYKNRVVKKIASNAGQPAGPVRFDNGRRPAARLNGRGPAPGFTNQFALARLSRAIQAEYEHFLSSSPIIRGPAELSRGILRLLEHSDYLAIISRPDRLVVSQVREALIDFVAGALECHAHDRGACFVAPDRSLSSLVGQFEVWAKFLSTDAASHKRIRVAVQMALAEEFNAYVTRP